MYFLYGWLISRPRVRFFQGPVPGLSALCICLFFCPWLSLHNLLVIFIMSQSPVWLGPLPCSSSRVVWLVIATPFKSLIYVFPKTRWYFNWNCFDSIDNLGESRYTVLNSIVAFQPMNMVCISPFTRVSFSVFKLSFTIFSMMVLHIFY